MNFTFYSKAVWRNVLFSISLLLLPCVTLLAQPKEGKAIIQPERFANLTAGDKAALIHQWIDLSRQFQVPLVIEQKAMAYCEANHIEQRVYQKYKVLLQTATNDQLPILNRINTCHFIIENYDASIFPVDVVRDILTELNALTK